jgi:hypothetical protein
VFLKPICTESKGLGLSLKKIAIDLNSKFLGIFLISINQSFQKF